MLLILAVPREKKLILEKSSLIDKLNQIRNNLIVELNSYPSIDS